MVTLYKYPARSPLHCMTLLYIQSPFSVLKCFRARRLLVENRMATMVEWALRAGAVPQEILGRATYATVARQDPVGLVGKI